MSGTSGFITDLLIQFGEQFWASPVHVGTFCIRERIANPTQDPSRARSLAVWRLPRYVRVKAPGVSPSAGSAAVDHRDRKSTRLNSSHLGISYAVFCLKKKKKKE